MHFRVKTFLERDTNKVNSGDREEPRKPKAPRRYGSKEYKTPDLKRTSFKSSKRALLNFKTYDVEDVEKLSSVTESHI